VKKRINNSNWECVKSFSIWYNTLILSIDQLIDWLIWNDTHSFVLWYWDYLGVDREITNLSTSPTNEENIETGSDSSLVAQKTHRFWIETVINISHLNIQTKQTKNEKWE
jgi:hypothetical protein